MDFVLANARVYTSNARQPWADTVAVRDGRFAFVGRRADLPDDHARLVHDLQGGMVLPGLVDSHTHPAAVAKSRWHVRLPWTDDVEEILDFIGSYGEAHPATEVPFLYFEYYPSTLLGDVGPAKELLDRAIADRPVLCQDFSEHAHWVNSRMLELMGVDRDTPDPVPGLEMFGRDDRGEPTGLLYEGVHTHFIDKLYDELGWRPDESVTAESIKPFFDFMTEHGVTALFDALIPDEEAIRAVARLDADGDLHLSYEGACRFRTRHDLPEAIATVRRYQSRYGSDQVRVRTVKLFLDGTNESGNSAVLAPLADDRDDESLGAIQMDVEELTDCLLLCNDSDVDVHIHMVGDRAFRVGCDAVQSARSRAAAGGGPWRIQVTFAHCELVDPADMSRPAELGVIVNWTTHWSGGYFGEESRAHLGDQRWRRMYAFNEIADSGAVVTFSSDVVTTYELERADPFLGMQVAHTRVDPQYPLDPGRHPGSVRPSPSSALPLELLVRGYTIDGARQLRLEDRAGSIEEGKAANLVVLTEDLFAADRDAVSRIRPATVVFEGRVVAGSWPVHGGAPRA
ncbi:amidohydrolase [Nocardioides hungaricus]